MLSSDLEIFLLGAAAVLDTALLLILLDRSNRRRIVAPLLLLVLGAWLFHSGVWPGRVDSTPVLAGLAGLCGRFAADAECDAARCVTRLPDWR